MKSSPETFPAPQPSFTPLLDQYFDLKKKCSDSLLLFRVGDFYEAYGEDGERLSSALDIVLTGKEVRGVRVPMAGFPYHTLDNHLKTLLTQGYKVAVSEQMEDASRSSGLIERNIVRFLTPGTILEGDLLNEKEFNFILAIFPDGKEIGLSWADVSTGDWKAAVIPEDKALFFQEFLKISPKEVLLPENFFRKDWFQEESVKLSFFPFESSLEQQQGYSHLPVSAQKACLFLKRYFQEIYRGNLPKLQIPVFHPIHQYMVLDPAACRNLELLENLSTGGKEGSLLHLLDQTKTPMGGRLLRQWLLYPLLDLKEIAYRQDAVEELLKQSFLLADLQNSLSRIGDLERILSRVLFQTANARDLLSMKVILQEIPLLIRLLASCQAPAHQKFLLEMPDFSSLTVLLEKGISSDPPLSLKEGGLIKEGFHPELDVLKKDLKEAVNWIAELEEKERKETGIKSLRVGFNQVFGYYLEVTKSNLSLVPSRYIRKQTLANAERYVTEELKKQEARILSLQERVKFLEYEIFCEIRGEVKKQDEALKKGANLLAQLDCFVSFAFLALHYRFTRPVVDDGDLLSISAGRHPVVESFSKEPFIPNDVCLYPEARLFVITGPNMAGKSTFLRQTALIVILAQMGSFVPADAAQIGALDRIFTRIGSSDDLHHGESTFFVEMKECAEILRNAGEKSMVLLDEVGRGTGTYDGLSLAWAVSEALLRTEAKVLFATHYHEMTDLADLYPAVKNFTVAVEERGDELIFLRKILPGSSNKSYGIQVARLAGIPESVVKRAGEILVSLETQSPSKSRSFSTRRAFSIPSSSSVQLHLFSCDQHPVLERLRTLDLNHITAIEALNLLDRWKKEYCKE
jgi:DNA mismatch repair protein MutS